MIGFLVVLGLSILALLLYKNNNNCNNSCEECKGCDHNE